MQKFLSAGNRPCITRRNHHTSFGVLSGSLAGNVLASNTKGLEFDS